MARNASKVLSPADAKAAAAANKLAIKEAKTNLKAANDALKAHIKEVAGKTKELEKAVAAAQKAHDKLVPSDE